MTLYYRIIDQQTVQVLLRFTTEAGEDGPVGETIEYLQSGESIFGVTFDEFLADGTGKIEPLPEGVQGLKVQPWTSP